MDVRDINLQELLDEVLASLAPVADARQITVRVENAEGMTLPGERFLLHRALATLLANAIDFSSPGQEVTLSVKCSRNHCDISVRDQGPGIPDYALGRIFEKFYSLHRLESGKKGTGLGLSFVKEIAELHRGRVELRNHPHGGAVAILTLPEKLSSST